MHSADRDVRSVAGMADAEAADGTAAQVPEGAPPEAFDLPISDMFANAKTLANVRTSDAVGELKTKLAEQLTAGTEADALRVVLVEGGDPPKQTDLEIETRTLEEYGVERGSKLMWQPQDPAAAHRPRSSGGTIGRRSGCVLRRRPRRSGCVRRRPSTRRSSARPGAGHT